MDSTVTLVSPSELVFDRDSLLNAELRLRGGTVVVYSIKTGRSMQTEVIKHEYDVDKPGSAFTATQPSHSVTVACIEKHEIRSDTISFRGQKPMKISKWLKNHSFTVSSPDTGEIAYVWKPFNFRELALYNARSDSTPIALYHPIHRHQVGGILVAEMPRLVMYPEAERIQELVITSLLIVAQNMRVQSQGAGKYIGYQAITVPLAS